MAKSTKAEVERRVSLVAGMLVEGRSRSQICAYALENWGVSDSQTDRYAVRARELIRDECREDFAYECALARRRLDDLYARSLDAGDLRTALSVVRETVELEGLATKNMSEETDADLGYYKAMSIYAQAVRTFCTPEQLQGIVRMSNEMGGHLDFATMPDYAERKDRERTLAIAVSDMETLGRTRTREELIEDGVFDAIPPI